MNYTIVSDLHLGSKYCYYEEFTKFLKELPDGALMLNGDVVSYWHKILPASHENVLNLLAEESLKRKVIWVRGNHDAMYELKNKGNIEFVNEYAIGKRLFISHGYDFDNVMPYNRTFLMLFRFLHWIRIKFGAEPMHVAFYAKRWPFFYEVLRRNVARNAVEHARENGFSAVTCGHTHFMDDMMIDGIRYINTGAWTEIPLCFLRVTDDSMDLVKVDILSK